MYNHLCFPIPGVFPCSVFAFVPCCPTPDPFLLNPPFSCSPYVSYEDQQRRLVEEIETLKERLQKYAEMHALDARSNTEKDALVRRLIMRIQIECGEEQVVHMVTGTVLAHGNCSCTRELCLHTWRDYVSALSCSTSSLTR